MSSIEDREMESTASENEISIGIPEKTPRTVPAVFPDVEFVSRTLP